MLRRLLIFLFSAMWTDGAMAVNSSNMDTSTFKKSLAELSKNLLYSSESDYPFEILDWGKKDAASLNAMMATWPAPVEKVAFADFFNRYIQKQELSGDDVMKASGERLRKLQSFIANNSADVAVWRSGRIEVGIYIIITAKDGQVLVLRTISVET